MQSAPDGWFYYAVTLAFGAALIWVILRYTGRIDTTLNKVEEAVNQLTTMTKIHDIHIQGLLKKVDQQAEDLETIREFYIVTYKK